MVDDDHATAAQRLVRLARDRGSSDNITVLAVRLGSPHAVPTDLVQANSSQPSDKNDGKETNDKKSSSDKSTGGDSSGASGDGNAGSGASDVSRDVVNSATEDSRLCLSSVKRSLDTDSDEEHRRTAAPDASSDDSPWWTTTRRTTALSDSQRNVFEMSSCKLGTAEIDTSLTSSTSWTTTTTSDDIVSRRSSAASDGGPRQSRRKGRHRSSCGLKENMLPTAGGEVGVTPPCTRHISPPPPPSQQQQLPGQSFDDVVGCSGLMSSHKTCRSLSWVSTGPLSNLLPQCSVNTSSVAVLRSPGVESRGRFPPTTMSCGAVGGPVSNRWTIAVEVGEVDVDMFSAASDRQPNNATVSVTSKPPAMSTSMHW